MIIISNGSSEQGFKLKIVKNYYWLKILMFKITNGSNYQWCQLPMVQVIIGSNYK